MDIFEKVLQNLGPLGKYSDLAHGYFTFPKLEGEISNRMIFQGKERLVWSLNNYIGLGNHPEVRKADAEPVVTMDSPYPMGARMMSGQTTLQSNWNVRWLPLSGKRMHFCSTLAIRAWSSIIDSLVDRKDSLCMTAKPMPVSSMGCGCT